MCAKNLLYVYNLIIKTLICLLQHLRRTLSSLLITFLVLSRGNHYLEFLILSLLFFVVFTLYVSILFFLKLFIYLFIYGCVGSLFLCEGFSLVAASGGHSSSRCAGLSLLRPLSLRSTGSRCAGSVVVAHGPSCSVACGMFPDQGSNPCALHWQADSQPLCHQGSPYVSILKHIMIGFMWF